MNYRRCNSVQKNETEKSYICIVWHGNLNVKNGVAMLFPAAFCPAMPGNRFTVLSEPKPQHQQVQFLRTAFQFPYL